MTNQNDGIFDVLKDIRNLLIRIEACFDDQYLQLQEKKEKERIFRLILTEPRKRIYPLLFDEQHFSQNRIAKDTGVTQQAISSFIKVLLSEGIIEQSKEEGKVIYNDKYNFSMLIEKGGEPNG